MHFLAPSPSGLYLIPYAGHCTVFSSVVTVPLPCPRTCVILFLHLPDWVLGFVRRYLAMSEPADFVHVFDAQKDFALSQEIDLFGEIAGISFSPDTEALFVGIADRTYGSLLEYNRVHPRSCMEYY